jgi:DNA-binding HxlR family transcriptional regulator
MWDVTSDAATLTGRLADRSAWRADRCPIGKALQVVGTRSAMLIMREAYYGTTRFDDFAERVGITEAVAATRLRELTVAGLLERRPYREPGQRTRHEYALTDKGRDLMPVVIGLFEWGAKHMSADGRGPVELSHADCGAPVQVSVGCASGHDVPLGEMVVSPTPRARDAARSARRLPR